MTNLLMTAAELLVLFLLPAGMVWLTKRSRFFAGVGAIALCYLFGFVLSLLPIPYDKGLAGTVASVLVALAIPLLLFGFDLRSVRSLAKSTLIAFGLLILSVLLTAAAAAFIGSAAGMEHTENLSGMAAGLYIGGTPNLFAIGSALFGRDSTVTNLANIADSLFGGVYFLLLLTVVKSLYARFLGSRKQPDGSRPEAVGTATAATEYDYSLLPRDRRGILRLIGVILLAAACLGVGVLAEILINGSMDGSLFIMLTVSVLGILFGFVRPVRETGGSYQVGQYLILVFSLGLSMSIDFAQLVGGILPVFFYFAAVQLVSLAVHLLLCKLFHIDGGTAIVTGTAGIYGPPFIAPVANAYGDKSLIAPGIVCGTLGLVTGNLFGLALALLLRTVL